MIGSITFVNFEMLIWQLSRTKFAFSYFKDEKRSAFARNFLIISN